MPKPKEQRVKDMKYINKLIKSLVDDANNPENEAALVYQKSYIPISDERINAIADDNNPQYKEVMEAGRVLGRAYDILNDTENKLHPYDFTGTLLPRTIMALMDYSLLDMDPNSNEYKRINQKNLEIIEKSKTNEGAKELTDQMVRQALSFDYERGLSSSFEDRMSYYKDNVNAILVMMTINDLLTSPQGQALSQPVKDALHSRLTMMQLVGGLTGLGKIVGSDYYPMLANMSAEDILTLSFEGKIGADPDATIEENEAGKDFFKALQPSSVGYRSNEDISRKQETYKVFTKNFLLGSGDASVKYEPRDAQGNPITFEEAINKYEAHEEVFFAERTKEAIDHILKGTAAPEKEFKDELVFFKGTTALRKADDLNPVLPHIQAMTPDEEAAAANVWFDSFKEKLAAEQGEFKFDANNPLDTNRFKTFSLLASEVSYSYISNDTGELVNVDGYSRGFMNSMKSVVGGKPEDFNQEQYIADSVALNNFTDQQKLELFRCAREGKLVFCSSSFDSTNEKGIYVDKNGKAGFSTNIFDLTTENNNLGAELALDPDFAKRHFDDCDYANDLAQQYGDYVAARSSQFVPGSIFTDVEQGYIMAEHQWEAMVQMDIRNHPEFYADEGDAAARRDLLVRTAKGSFSGQVAEWDEYKDVLLEHPIDSYDEIKNLIEEKTGVSVEDAISNGYLSYGEERNQLFTVGNKALNPNVRVRPWEAVDAISQKVFSDEPVYVSLPAEDGKIKEYIIDTRAESPKLTEVVPLKVYEAAKNAIQQINADILATGVTKGDSQEFKDFKAKLSEVAKNPLPRTKKEFEDVLNTVKEKAANYSFAKLDQSMNSRREKRFVSANNFIVVASALTGDYTATPRGIEMYIIAGKACKAALLSAAKSSDPQKAQAAREVLTDRKKFDRQIDMLYDSPAFQAMYMDKSLKDLKSISKNGATSLAKDVQKGQEAYRKQQLALEERERNLARI